jgi:hypothetical protein
VAEGTIYLLIGGLALAGAFDRTQRPSGSKGAMSRLADVPLGHGLLALLGLGLCAFVVWQVMQVLMDPDRKPDDGITKRTARRAHHLWSAAVHCVLVGMAGWRLLGCGAGHSQAKAPKDLTAFALHLPAGRWLVAIIGTGFVVFTVVEWILAFRPRKGSHLKLKHTAWRYPVVAVRILGYVARGALFGLIGAFLILASWHHNAHKATGIAGALQFIRQLPHGTWLLAAMAIGLIAYGLAQIAKMRYRAIRTR